MSHDDFKIPDEDVSNFFSGKQESHVIDIIEANKLLHLHFTPEQQTVFKTFIYVIGKQTEKHELVIKLLKELSIALSNDLEILENKIKTLEEKLNREQL